MRPRGVTLVIGLILMTQLITVAQTRPRRARKSSSMVSERGVLALAKRISAARRDVTAAANDYKASLQKLLAFQQSDIEAAAKSVEGRRELVAQNVISKLELEVAERALTVARAKLKETERQLSEADNLIGEALAQQGNTIRLCEEAVGGEEETRTHTYR